MRNIANAHSLDLPQFLPAGSDLAVHGAAAGAGRDLIINGLLEEPPRIDCKFLYDARGAALFEAITQTQAYYPTRTETSILRRHAPAIAQWIGPGARIVEPGSGSGIKSQLLLDALIDPRAYVPIDVSAEQLYAYTESVRERHPTLAVQPLNLDYNQPFNLPDSGLPTRTVTFFPGSTIGNFQPASARAFLARLRRFSDGLIIGVDLRKDSRVLDLAYNDPEGITAQFNLNVLHNVNRLAAADFDPSNFRHHAHYNEQQSRIEMHLVALRDHVVHLDDGRHRLLLRRGSAINTEHSYKYDPAGFVQLAGSAGFRPRSCFTDVRRYFAVFLLD